MLQMKDPRVSETANELYEKIMKSSNPYKRLEKYLSTDHVELTRVHYGSNVYLLNTIFWSCVTFHLTVKFHKLNRPTEFEVMVMQCLLKSLEIVSESFGLGVYSYYSKDLNRLRMQRSDATKEGRKARTNLLNRIKKKQVIYFIYINRLIENGKVKLKQLKKLKVNYGVLSKNWKRTVKKQILFVRV